jgi:hypothetical protein
VKGRLDVPNVVSRCRGSATFPRGFEVIEAEMRFGTAPVDTVATQRAPASRVATGGRSRPGSPRFAERLPHAQRPSRSRPQPRNPPQPTPRRPAVRMRASPVSPIHAQAEGRAWIWGRPRRRSRREWGHPHNITKKVQAHHVETPGGTEIPQKKTSYDFGYDYTSSHPHARTRSSVRVLSERRVVWSDRRGGVCAAPAAG